MRAMACLAAAGFRGFKISVVVTRHNVSQLDAFQQIADDHGAQLRLTRLRPSGRGADVWPDLHPTGTQQRELYEWLTAHGERVLTGDSFFHLSAYGDALPGLNLCGAGRVVCLIDPVGDVYACPFAIHQNFLAGNVRGAGGSHLSNQGWGPWEVNLGYVLTKGMEWNNLFLGTTTPPLGWVTGYGVAPASTP